MLSLSMHAAHDYDTDKVRFYAGEVGLEFSVRPL